MKGFPDAARPCQCDRAKPKNSAGDALIDRYRFHVPEQQLQRSPPEQAHFDDDSLIGDAKFRCSIIDHWKNDGKKPDRDHDRSDNWLNDQKNASQNHERARFPENDPMQSRRIDNVLVGEQIRFHVSHCVTIS